MKKEKKRLDVLLVERGLAASREKAKALIMAGIVYVNQNKEDKAGACFDPEEAEVEVRGTTLRYVSRGGLKLEKALKVFPIDLHDRVCMDIGASIYRLHAAERGRESVFHRRGIRTAGLETSK